MREAVDDEFLARPMTEAVARLLQAAELLRYNTPEVVTTFLTTRCPGVSGAVGFDVRHARPDPRPGNGRSHRRACGRGALRRAPVA